MKIAGCVVLFNPENDCLNNIQSYINIVDKIYVLDNSTTYNYKLVDTLCQIQNIEYISLNGNMGIAYALKVGVEKAVSSNFDLC